MDEDPSDRIARLAKQLDTAGVSRRDVLNELCSKQRAFPSPSHHREFLTSSGPPTPKIADDGGMTITMESLDDLPPPEFAPPPAPPSDPEFDVTIETLPQPHYENASDDDSLASFEDYKRDYEHFDFDMSLEEDLRSPAGRLYHELTAQEERSPLGAESRAELRFARMLDDLRTEEAKTLTFRPQTTPYKTKRKRSSFLKRVLAWEAEREKRLEELRASQEKDEKEELEKCKFRPSINEDGASTDTVRVRTGVSVFDRLYADNEKKKRREETEAARETQESKKQRRKTHRTTDAAVVERLYSGAISRRDRTLSEARQRHAMAAKSQRKRKKRKLPSGLARVDSKVKMYIENPSATSSRSRLGRRSDSIGDSGWLRHQEEHLDQALMEAGGGHPEFHLRTAARASARRTENVSPSCVTGEVSKSTRESFSAFLERQETHRVKQEHFRTAEGTKRFAMQRGLLHRSRSRHEGRESSDPERLYKAWETKHLDELEAARNRLLQEKADLEARVTRRTQDKQRERELLSTPQPSSQPITLKGPGHFASFLQKNESHAERVKQRQERLDKEGPVIEVPLSFTPTLHERIPLAESEEQRTIRLKQAEKFYRRQRQIAERERERQEEAARLAAVEEAELSGSVEIRPRPVPSSVRHAMKTLRRENLQPR